MKTNVNLKKRKFLSSCCKLKKSEELIHKRTRCKTNGIEGLWNKCRSKKRTKHGVYRKEEYRFLQENLDEVMLRHNIIILNKAKILLFNKQKYKENLNLNCELKFEIF